MSQEQPMKPQELIKYGDIFDVQGELAEKAVAPRDAAMMQSTETRIFGQIKKGGPASVMQAAANQNEKAGFLEHSNVSDVAKDVGVIVTKTELPGKRVLTELVGGQVVGINNDTSPLLAQSKFEQGSITIGEALEATALSAGEKPVDYSDAAAIQAAEVRATGRTNIVPGGVAAAAQSAATRNARVARDDEKTKLGQVLSEATAKLPSDRPVTRRDAEGVIGAELRNDPNLSTHPGGVAASIAAAARINQQINNLTSPTNKHAPPTP